MNCLENLKKQVAAYQPYNEQEERDRELILRCLDCPDVLTRENTVFHMTASSWVTNSERTKVLFCFHKIYQSWSWLGGHADGSPDLLKVAVREACEESGLISVKPVQNDIFSMEVLTVDGHWKKGKYVSSHLHLNLTYLLETDENAALSAKEDENNGVRWFGLDEAVKASNELWFRENVYQKLIGKMRKMQETQGRYGS